MPDLPDTQPPPLDPKGAIYHLEEACWVSNSPTFALKFRGWAFVTAQASPIVLFQARHGDSIIAQCPALFRPDVRAHFAGEPRAESTGFELMLPPLDPLAQLQLAALLSDGTCVPLLLCRGGDLRGRQPVFSDYAAWAQAEDPDQSRSAPSGSVRTFTIVLPVYNPAPEHLRAALDSVQGQQHPHWELRIVDDASDLPGVRSLLADFAQRDPRIHVIQRTANGGIARASNDGLDAAEGEYVVLLDHDDILRPHALAEFNRRLDLEPDLDVLYSDEDKLDPSGRRCLPLLKPPFSPEFLKGVMYVGHALCVRTRVAREVGGFDPAFDGVQDYEFLLRVIERTRRVGHVPRMLYHWRQSPLSSALAGNIKGDMDQKQVEAVRAHLKRTGDPRAPRALGGHRVGLEPTTPPTSEVFRLYEVCTVVPLLLAAAAGSHADVLIVLAANAEPVEPLWQQELATMAALPDAGCVTAHLISREGLILESGCIIHGHQVVPLMRGLDPAYDGYNGTIVCSREVDTVSPACVAVRRALIQEAGIAETEWHGFCANLRNQGLYHRVCARVRVRLPFSWDEPSEATPRRPDTREFYNPYFDPSRGDFSLARSVNAVKAESRPIHFHVDQPTNWSRLSRCLIIRGWCFSPAAAPVQQIRFRATGRIFNGILRLPRPDVRAIVPSAPDDNTGFEIRGTLPAGHMEITLEARTEGGAWVALVSRMVTVERQLFPLWLTGGGWQELILSQMPAHMAHPPRPLVAERFPSLKSRPAAIRLAIVTPSYNQCCFLAETVRSVTGQALASLDYVVQDGGSTDGSVEILRRWGRDDLEVESGRQEAGTTAFRSSVSGFRPPACGLPSPRNAQKAFVWESSPDRGQADAIAKGFTKTTGGPDDLMAWINSDDFYLPGALGFVADYFARHPDVDVIYGHRVLVDENSQEIGRWFLPKHDPEVLRLNDFIPQETMFWRRRIWDKVGGIDTSFKFAMDWDLLLRFQAAGAKIVRVPYFLACFRIHSAQKTSAQMHSIGQAEITRLRERTFGRALPPEELETNPILLSYLRHSAWLEWLWSWGWRGR